MTTPAPAILRRTALLASAVGLVIAFTATAGSASAHPTAKANPGVVNTGKIYFGVDGTDSQAAAGLTVARHLYGQLSGDVPNARMVTMSITGYTYAGIAAAKPGSAVYTNIVRWADTIRARGTMTFFGFVKEPEQSNMAMYGSVSQYLAAYRHVVDVFRSQKMSNVRYVWQMTAYSFSTPGARAAINYYPGNTYVDAVGEDPYNWAGCGPGGPWRDLSTAANAGLSFANAHGKLTVLAEFGSQTGPLRASWLGTARQWLIQNRSHIQAAFYFDRPPTTPEGQSCIWSLTSSQDIAAFRSIVADTTYFAS